MLKSKSWLLWSYPQTPAVNYISLIWCATTPWVHVLIFELLKSRLNGHKNRPHSYSEACKAGQGEERMWVFVWKLLLREQILQSTGCSHGLLTPVARSNWRVVIISKEICLCALHSSALSSNLQSFCPTSGGTYSLFWGDPDVCSEMEILLVPLSGTKGDMTLEEGGEMSRVDSVPGEGEVTAGRTALPRCSSALFVQLNITPLWDVDGNSDYCHFA